MNRLPIVGKSTAVRQHIAAFRALLVFTVLCGLIYPAVMVGSSLLCQEFVDAKGNPLPKYFQPRPSAAVDATSKTDYGGDPGFSAASNLGPDNPALVQLIRQRRQAIAAFDHVPVAQIPPDAVTASASGLDPDISRRTRPSRSTGSPEPGTCRCPRSARWYRSTRRTARSASWASHP
jgi:K+-transporting ATPase c subunit